MNYNQVHTYLVKILNTYQMHLNEECTNGISHCCMCINRYYDCTHLLVCMYIVLYCFIVTIILPHVVALMGTIKLPEVIT